MLRRHFNHIDADGNGDVSWSELKAYYAIELGVDLMEFEVDDMMREADFANKDGRIQFAEFVDIAVMCYKGRTTKNWKKVFDQFAAELEEASKGSRGDAGKRAKLAPPPHASLGGEDDTAHLVVPQDVPFFNDAAAKLARFPDAKRLAMPDFVDAAVYARAGEDYGIFSITMKEGMPYPPTTFKFLELSPGQKLPSVVNDASVRELSARSRVVCVLTHDGIGEHTWVMPPGTYWAKEQKHGGVSSVVGAPPSLFNFTNHNGKELYLCRGPGIGSTGISTDAFDAGAINKSGRQVW